MRFYKLHGLGNDYVYLDCFHQGAPRDPVALSVRVSRPHFGIGSDGLILIEPSAVADARMRIFNADGSEAMMCGNGIRCVGKYLYDSGLCRRAEIDVETASGVKRLWMRVENGRATGARVDMGAPEYDLQPVRAEVAGQAFELHRVSMGNPHAALFLPALPEDALFYQAGAALERHPAFPDRANIEFCCADARDRLRVRVWERGSGETLACGTGACAALVAAHLCGLCDRRATVALPGGELEIDWNEADNHVYMTGPATLAFQGEWPDEADH